MFCQRIACLLVAIVGALVVFAERKRKFITREHKVWLCARRDSHRESYEVLSQEFDRRFEVNYQLDNRTLSSIVGNASKRRRNVEQETHTTSRLKISKQSGLEDTMVMWLHNVVANNGKVSDAITQFCSSSANLQRNVKVLNDVVKDVHRDQVDWRTSYSSPYFGSINYSCASLDPSGNRMCFEK